MGDKSEKIYSMFLPLCFNFAHMTFDTINPSRGTISLLNWKMETIHKDFLKLIHFISTNKIRDIN